MKGKYLLGLVLLTLGVTSCKKDAVFDQNSYDNLINKAFVVDNVDPSHDWATVATAKVNVKLMGRYADGTIKIYGENPIVIDSPTLLVSGTAAEGKTFSAPFSFQLAKPMVYVTHIDNEGYMSVIPKEVSDGAEIDVTFGETAQSASPRRVLTVNDQIPSISYSSMEALRSTVLDGAQELTQAFADNEGNSAPKRMKITSGTWNYGCDCLGDESGRTLYVGKNVTWNIPANTTVAVGKNGIIFVDEGAKINLGSKAKLGSDNAGQIIFMKNVEVKDNGSDGEIYFANGTSGDHINYNAGIINVHTFNNNYGYFYNANELITSDYQSSSNGGQNVNRGSIQVNGDANMVNSALFNCCKCVVTGALTVAYIVNGGYIECGSLKPDGSYNNSNQHWLYLGNNAIMNVKGEFNTQTGLNISGPTSGDNFGIFQCVSIPKNQYLPLTFINNLYVCRQEMYTDQVVRQHYHDGIWDNKYWTNENWIELNWETCFNKNNEGNGQAQAAAYQQVNFVKDEDECSPCYQPDGPRQVQDRTFSMRYCFEDNFPDAGDYDFNDVVLTVTPEVEDKTVKLTVSLDAVGATKNIGAAMRLVGVSAADLASYSVTQGFPSPSGTYDNIDTDETFLMGGQAPNQTNSAVIVLFKDAHWAINPVEASVGGVQRLFYNTIKDANNTEGQQVNPRTAIYTLEFKNAIKAKEMLRQNIYDVFIITPSYGAYWEVHTVQNDFKTDQVLSRKPDGYREAYGNNKPWAIMVPGNDFQYPVEWQVIGTNKNNSLSGAYRVTGSSFAEWAENMSTATDWYQHPDADLVY